MASSGSERGFEAGARRVVYVTYDGVEDQLGQSQVLPYLRALARRGHRFHIVSFEKRPHRLRAAERLEHGITLTSLRYHKTPTVPATAFDMAQGLAAATVARLLDGADLVHVRSLVPCTMVLPLVAALRVPLLFDTRSLWADEKVDVGHWPRGGPLYRTAKRIERAALSMADVVTVLTNNVQGYLRTEYPHRRQIDAPIRVIPTCADLSAFRPDVAPDAALSRELSGHRVLVYLGSMGRWYMPAEMARFYRAFRETAGCSTRLLVLTRGEPTDLLGPLGEMGLAGDVVHRSAQRDEVARYLRCGDAAMCFILPEFSKRASAPTKLGELLGCGLPLVANVVGDVDAVLEGARSSVICNDMSDQALEAAARELHGRIGQPGMSDDARRAAERWFSLDEGAAAYDEIYRAMPRRHRGLCQLPDATWPRPPAQTAPR